MTRDVCEHFVPVDLPCAKCDDPHVYDEDGTCTRCGFDGAEWAWWRTTYEGKALPHLQMPRCRERQQ